MAAVRVPIDKFVEAIKESYRRKDGYIMGSKGQNPRKWAKDSWWFTQYTTTKQREKALYWREHAQRVWDCNGLAEGLYEDFAGVNINTKARCNYAQWCDPKGKGLIPAMYRVPGAAVFWGNNADSIHHVAYLYRPVDAAKPEGDWYIIEARGVMYGVVKTRLNNRKPNFWGWMTKYFDYETGARQAEVTIEGGDCWIRAEPNVSAEAVGVAREGERFEYAGRTSEDGWLKIAARGGEGWVSGKYGRLSA